MTTDPTTASDSVLRRVVDELTAQLLSVYPTVEPAQVRDIVLHAAVEFCASGYSGPVLRRQIHRRANAQLGAMTGRPLAIRSAPPLPARRGR